MAVDQPNINEGTSKLIKEEEREIGKVSLHVYKLHCTGAFGWCGVAVVPVMSLLWQVSLMAGAYWLAFETSKERAMSFNPSLFIFVYGIIAVVSFVLIMITAFSVTFVGVKTVQIFFAQILHSLLYAPMSFFDATPSGRILSRASTDQTNIDLFLPFFMSLTISMYITVISIFIITCQNSRPTVFLLIQLAWLNVWYRVSAHSEIDLRVPEGPANWVCPLCRGDVREVTRQLNQFGKPLPFDRIVHIL